MKLEEILKHEPIANDKELSSLLIRLNQLGKELNSLSREKFNRINPFIENIFDWKENGTQHFGEETNITVYNNTIIVGDVKVGNNTWIGPNTAIDGTGGVEIGKNCSISSGVQVLSHDTVKWAVSGGKQPYEYGRVSIGNCCFIGTNAIITKGVKIGNHCVIGAGSIVTKSVPDFSIVMGIPATVKGKVVLEGDDVKLVFEAKD
jgi:acetyltransferase-like isoleucine patch superfamily enzyme